MIYTARVQMRLSRAWSGSGGGAPPWCCEEVIPVLDATILCAVAPLMPKTWLSWEPAFCSAEDIRVVNCTCAHVCMVEPEVEA